MRSTDLTLEIIGAAIKIHRSLGPELLESAYEACLADELQRMGFRADLVGGGRVVVELKCQDCLHPLDEAQLLSHPQLLGWPDGISSLAEEFLAAGKAF